MAASPTRGIDKFECKRYNLSSGKARPDEPNCEPNAHTMGGKSLENMLIVYALSSTPDTTVENATPVDMRK